MSFLYRTAVIISRKQAYIDWANGLDDDGVDFPLELAERRDIYLGPYREMEQTLDEVLDQIWADIFDEELLGWCTDEERWPASRTRELFDAWFAAELAESVIDLVPEDPLTEEDMDVADLEEALHCCSWCGREVVAEHGRMTAFGLTDRGPLEHREGLVLDVIASPNRVVRGVVTLRDSSPAQDGADLLFRACSRPCEKRLLKAVPRGLRELDNRLVATPLMRS